MKTLISTILADELTNAELPLPASDMQIVTCVGTSRLASAIPASVPGSSVPARHVISQLAMPVEASHTSLPVPEESKPGFLKSGVRTWASATITFSAQGFLLNQHESFHPTVAVVLTYLPYDGLRFTHRDLLVVSAPFWDAFHRSSFS
jgi:hypothetical protein